MRDALEASTLKEKQNTRIRFEDLEEDVIGTRGPGTGRRDARSGGTGLSCAEAEAGEALAALDQSCLEG